MLLVLFHTSNLYVLPASDSYHTVKVWLRTFLSYVSQHLVFSVFSSLFLSLADTISHSILLVLFNTSNLYPFSVFDLSYHSVKEGWENFDYVFSEWNLLPFHSDTVFIVQDQFLFIFYVYICIYYQMHVCASL